MTKPIDQQIAEARAAHRDLLQRTENLLLARRPIDHDLEAEIMEVELDMQHLETLRAEGCASRYDQVPYEPQDLELRNAA